MNFAHSFSKLLTHVIVQSALVQMVHNFSIVVAAFSPAASSMRPSSLMMAFETAEGAQKPLGFWDPLG